MIITEMSTLERLKDNEIRSEYGSETLKYDVAAALAAARKMKNLTQVALANIAGVSQAYIAKLESGEANPTIGRIGAILASIWLKCEINLVPLLIPERQDDALFEQPSHENEMAEQDTIIGVLPTVVSPSIHMEKKQEREESMFQKALLKLFEQKEKINVYHNIYGIQERASEEHKTYLSNEDYTNTKTVDIIMNKIYKDFNSTKTDSIIGQIEANILLNIH